MDCDRSEAVIDDRLSGRLNQLPDPAVTQGGSAPTMSRDNGALAERLLPEAWSELGRGGAAV